MGKRSKTLQPQNDHTLTPENIIALNTDSSDDYYYMSSAGDDSSKYDLEDGYSTSGDYELEYPHCVNLTWYLLKDVQNKDNSDINDI